MDDIQDADFFEKVRSYLKGDMPLDELDRWIVERLPALVPPRQDAVSELAGLIQLWVSELGQGHRDPEEVRSSVREYLRRHGPVVVSFRVGVHPESASASTPIHLFMRGEFQVLSFSHR